MPLSRPTPSWKRILFLVAKTTIFSLLFVFIIWLILFLDWNKLFKIFTQINPIFWFLAVLTKGIVLLFRGYRCYLIFPDKSVIKNSESIRYGILGQFGNVIFPAKIGEGIKVVLLKQKSQLPFIEVIFIVLTERALDLWCILLGLSLFLNLPPFLGHFKYFSWGFIVAFFLLSGFFFLAHKIKLPVRIRPLAKHCSQKKTLIPLSLWIWFLESLALWFFLKAFHFGNLFQAVSVTFFYHLAIALPTTPGNAVFFEAVYIYAFGLFGISTEVALALSILVQFSLFGLYIFLGILMLIYEGFSLQDLKRLSHLDEDQIGA